MLHFLQLFKEAAKIVLQVELPTKHVEMVT